MPNDSALHLIFLTRDDSVLMPVLLAPTGPNICPPPKRMLRLDLSRRGVHGVRFGR